MFACEEVGVRQTKMSGGIAGIDFQSFFLRFDSLVVLLGQKIFARQIVIRVQVERLELDSAPVMLERLLMISEILEVEAVQDMGAAQVWIQLEGALKFPRGGSPLPLNVVREPE